MQSSFITIPSGPVPSWFTLSKYEFIMWWSKRALHVNLFGLQNVIAFEEVVGGSVRGMYKHEQFDWLGRCAIDIVFECFYPAYCSLYMYSERWYLSTCFNFFRWKLLPSLHELWYIQSNTQLSQHILDFKQWSAMIEIPGLSSHFVRNPHIHVCVNSMSDIDPTYTGEM